MGIFFFFFVGSVHTCLFKEKTCWGVILIVCMYVCMYVCMTMSVFIYLCLDYIHHIQIHKMHNSDVFKTLFELN